MYRKSLSHLFLGLMLLSLLLSFPLGFNVSEILVHPAHKGARRRNGSIHEDGIFAVLFCLHTFQCRRLPEPAQNEAKVVHNRKSIMPHRHVVRIIVTAVVCGLVAAAKGALQGLPVISEPWRQSMKTTTMRMTLA